MALGIPEPQAPGFASGLVMRSAGPDGMTYAGFDPEERQFVSALHYKPMFLKGLLDFTGKKSEFQANLAISDAWNNVKSMDNLAVTLNKGMISGPEGSEETPLSANVSYEDEFAGGNLRVGARFDEKEEPRLNMEWGKRF